MSLELLRCARKLVLTAVCLAVLDLTLGGASRYVFFGQRSGKFCRINRAMASAEARLFVFGSSHAAQHYVPEVLQGGLGISAYNAGVLGQEILFHKTLESVVLSRTTPEIIVLDVDPNMLYESSEAYDRLSDLKPFYCRYPNIIGPVMDLRSPFERVFLVSRLYQYNSTLVHVLRYAVAPQPDSNGYRPEFSIMSPPTQEQERYDVEVRRAFQAGRKLDRIMVDALDRFAADALRRNIKVFYFMSPGALPRDLESSASFRQIEAIVRQRGVPFFNFRNHPEFIRRYSLFSDAEHLNDAGARRYSGLVAQSIKKQLAADGS